MSRSNIEWTESTWNPVTGCSKISEGCLHCYAERMTRRLKAMGQKRYKKGFIPTVHPDTLNLPLQWKKPRMIFVNSMSDLFHELVPDEFIHRLFEIISITPQHTYQILTKRSQRLVLMSSGLLWPRNLWMGVTVESNAYKFRIDHLRLTGAKVKFISFEPLLDAVFNLDLEGIDWAIAGGESGPGARTIDVAWVRALRDDCMNQSVPFFFKQWGGIRKKLNGRLLDGRVWSEYPAVRVS